jgi:hypothetical protein
MWPGCEIGGGHSMVEGGDIGKRRWLEIAGQAGGQGKRKLTSTTFASSAAVAEAEAEAAEDIV